MSPPLDEPVLDESLLRAEQRRTFIAARSGISAPAAGAIYWLALGIAGYYLTPKGWCLLAFYTSGLIFPLAIALQKPLRCNLFVKGTLDSMIFPVLLPVMLCFGFTIPAFFVAPELVPLGLSIGMTMHWPSIGWMYGQTASFSAHAIARVGLAVIIWFAWPDQRFTWIPLSTALVYAATFFYLVYATNRKARPPELR